MVAWWNCSTHTCTCIYIKHLRYNRESLIYSHWMLGFILGSVCHQAQVLEFIGCEDIVIWVILIFCSVGSSLKQLWLNSRDVLLSGSDNCRCPGDPWRGSQTGRGAFCNFFFAGPILYQHQWVNVLTNLRNIVTMKRTFAKQPCWPGDHNLFVGKANKSSFKASFCEWDVRGSNLETTTDLDQVCNIANQLVWAVTVTWLLHVYCIIHNVHILFN